MAYTADKPALAESSDELRARIPGWGVDLDPKDRPSVPRERFDPDLSGAHWDFPEKQPEKWPRERSIEHKFLTPVFGTSCPPKGVSGIMRKYAYRRFSEGRAAHWLILMAADRVDSLGSHFQSLLTLRPDNPITETGVLSEFTRHGIASRMGKKRGSLGSRRWGGLPGAQTTAEDRCETGCYCITNQPPAPLHHLQPGHRRDHGDSCLSECTGDQPNPQSGSTRTSAARSETS